MRLHLILQHSVLGSARLVVLVFPPPPTLAAIPQWQLECASTSHTAMDTYVYDTAASKTHYTDGRSHKRQVTWDRSAYKHTLSITLTNTPRHRSEKASENARTKNLTESQYWVTASYTIVHFILFWYPRLWLYRPSPTRYVALILCQWRRRVAACELGKLKPDRSWNEPDIIDVLHIHAPGISLRRCLQP